jgi:hypothetical protein
MIWLRHELWEHEDGPGYRLATRTGTDETGAAHPEGVLKQVFYAPSPAAAKAQYWALRQLGPIIPSSMDADEPFTLAQLQAQLAQYPDDATLHGQPALHVGEDAPVAIVETADAEPEAEAVLEEPATDVEPSVAGPAVAEAAPEPVNEPVDEPASNVVPIRIPVANAAILTPEASDAEPHSREMAVMERQPAPSSGALALALAELEPTPHTTPQDDQPTAGHAPLSVVASHSSATGDEHTLSEPVVGGPTGPDADAVEPLVPEPVTDGAETVEPLVPEPVAVEAAAEPDPLGPITAVGTAAIRGRKRRRKSGFFGGLLRVLMLLIILGAVVLGVGLATGTWTGPGLLAEARALPDQVRDLSIVKTLLP